jgi:hypothetical protein
MKNLNRSQAWRKPSWSSMSRRQTKVSPTLSFLESVVDDHYNAIITEVYVTAKPDPAERLTQALRISKLQSRKKKNRALISVTPRETTLVIPWKLIKNTIPWRLRTQDLPLLHHYATKLCTCLDPSSIRSNTDERLREALEILPQVNH